MADNKKPDNGRHTDVMIKEIHAALPELLKTTAVNKALLTRQEKWLSEIEKKTDDQGRDIEKAHGRIDTHKTVFSIIGGAITMLWGGLLAWIGFNK